MPTNTTLTSGNQVSLASPAQIAMLLICCTAGTVGKVYSFDSNQDPTVDLGAGIGVDAVAYLQGTGQTVRAVPCTPTWSPCPSVVRSGGTSGPAVTAALTAGAPGCFDDHHIVARVSRSGALSVGQVAIAYDGSTEIEVLPIPSEIPAVLRGIVDIAHGADLEGLHFDFTAPAAKVLTFAAGTLAASPAALKAATATSGSIVALAASDLLAPGLAAILLNPRRLTFLTAGTAADAPATVAIVGTRRGVAVTETLALSQTSGSVTSVNEYDVITSLTYAAGDGTGATIAIGYHGGFATAGEIVDAFNALAVAAPLALRARAAQATSGATYLELYSVAAGAAVTATIDAAASTVDTGLGFTSGASNLSTTGAAASIVLPNTGLTLSFPVGDYVVDEKYSLTCVGPRASISALGDGAQAARDDYLNNPFGFIVPAQPSDTESNCAATQAMLSALTHAWLIDEAAAIFVQACTGSPFHVASSTLATNDTAIRTASTALLSGFAASLPALDSVAVGDVYLQGARTLRSGSFRRTAALAWAYQRANAAKLAADVGDGIVPGSLLGPDGVTRARDENRASTKLGGSQGPGFSVLKSTSRGLSRPKFGAGTTRAGATSELRFSGVVAVGLEIARLIFAEVEPWDAQTWPKTPGTGAIADTKAASAAGHLAEVVNGELAPKEGEQNYSALAVSISTAAAFTGTVPVTAAFETLAEIERVRVSVIASGKIALSP